MPRPQDGSSNIRLAIEVNWGQWNKQGVGERKKERRRQREGERVGWKKGRECKSKAKWSEL